MSIVEDAVDALLGKQICIKCQGEGWLWSHELDDYSRTDSLCDDNKYTCDMCHGTKLISIINSYGE